MIYNILYVRIYGLAGRAERRRARRRGRPWWRRPPGRGRGGGSAAWCWDGRDKNLQAKPVHRTKTAIIKVSLSKYYII